MKKKNILLFICLIIKNNWPMDNEKNDYRDSTLAYSTELGDSIDFNSTPMNSPRVPLDIPQEKKSCFCRCLKKLCCFLCCCKKKPEERLTVEYETIH